MNDLLNWVALLVIATAALGLLLSRDWRLSLAALAMQYLGVFWFVQLHWSVTMASAKLVTGWMAAAILIITQIGTAAAMESEASWLEGRLFRLPAAALVILITFAAAPRLASWLGDIPLAEAWGGLILIGAGLFHLGITAYPLRVVTALLTALAGFEILYSAVEGSSLVAALLAGVNLGLPMIGAYLLNISTAEEAE